jgi:CubicO group peptidase (beta-lactamase class C family)
LPIDIQPPRRTVSVLTLQTVHRIDAIVARAQSEGRAPSIIAAVVRDGTVAHVASAGETPVPARDTQYRIGSISKSFTAAVVLNLRDEGQLDLDDPLGKHLEIESFVRRMNAAPAEVRLRQLLGHAAGMQREPDGDWWERSAGRTLDQLLAGVTADKLAFAPYGRFHYSNLAYGLLGAVIERLTGQSWWEAVSQRLLEPLGMTCTTYHPREPFARGYVLHPWHQTLREEPRHDADAMAPAGQLWSTAEDLATWAAALASPGAAGRPGANITEMATPVMISDLESWTEGYGLGLQLWRRGERVFAGHTGSMPGYLAVLLAHRPSRTGVVVFTNTYTLRGWRIGHLGLSIMEAVLDGEPPQPPTPWRPAAQPPTDIDVLCGRWWWMGRELECRWDADRSELVIQYTAPGADEWRFVRRGADRWLGLTSEAAGERLLVRRTGEGHVWALDIATYVLTRNP